MKIGIISVPHTGTHTVSNIFGLDEPLDIGRHYETKRFEIVNNHTTYPSVFESAEQNGFVIVTPMRHPHQVLRSFVKRHNDLLTYPEAQEALRQKLEGTGIEYEDAAARMHPSAVIKHFKTLIMMNDLYDINYLPVDTDNRQEYLNKFNERFRLNLTSKWGKHNSVGKYYVCVLPEMEEELKQFMEDNKSFFNKFHY